MSIPHKDIAETIIALKNADLKLRDQLIHDGILGQGYHPDMQTLHHQNAETLDSIIQEIGYPTVDKVGTEANAAAWLIIQHSIGNPEFMKSCVRHLENAVNEHQENPKHLAYLTDRVAVFEGKPQRYGTQFDWDENGELSPQLYDDVMKVNERRKAVGLNTLEEQTEVIRRQAKENNESPPEHYEQRQKEMEEWRQSVGW